MHAWSARRLCLFRNRGIIVKLNARQIFGLGAIVVFGAILVFRFTQPSEKEIMEQRLASLPRMTVPQSALELPPLDRPSTSAPQMPAPTADGTATTTAETEPAVDYLALGPQEARDDLYCAGILRAHFDPTLKADGVGHAQEVLEYARTLAGSGVTRLRAEGLAKDLDWVFFDNAHDEKAKADYAAATPRISAAACEARGEALPTDTLKLP